MNLQRLRPRSVAVLRALQLGDLLCAVPALRALRAALPRARGTLIGLPWAAEFARRLPAYIDDFVEFPGWPGLPEREVDSAAVPRFLHEMKARRFDLALQLHGSGAHVNSLTCLLGAARTAGFFVPGAFCPDPDSYLPYPDGGPEPRRLLALLEFLGAPPAGAALEFPVSEEDERRWAELARRFELRPRAFACVHAGARWPSRRWPVERFAGVADALAADGLAVVLTGSAAEGALASELGRRMRAPAVNLAGRTDLGTLAALLRDARLVVCNDTGVSHLAAAVGTRSVVVASGSDVRRWAPEDAARHRVLSVDVDCRPCDFPICPIGHPCALELGEDAVARQAVEAASL